jgi:vancomycin resistance protein YoaR
VRLEARGNGMTRSSLTLTIALLGSLALAREPLAPPSSNPPRLELRLEASEPEIRGGQLETVILKKRFALDPQKIGRSREHNKISTTLEPDLARIFKSLEREPINARFVFEAGSWIARQRSGWRVNEAATRDALLGAIRSDASAAAIKLEVTRPERDVETWFRRGIRFFYGGGDSSFRGSPGFRVTNIVAGVRQLDGLTLEPGAVFDFNRTVRVNAALGFVPGWVISQGTLKKAIGGGICQVCTTIFRAAWNAGLPILERHEHSYRVHYYDPPGTDATTSASKNLRFLNDTGAPLFIQVSTDLPQQTLQMNLFGPRPDRRVVISSPVVYDVRSPPGARLITDGSVPLGQMRLIDRAEPGMRVTVTRSVTLETGEVRRDTIRSSYVPWGAIYAVNPNDLRARR